MQKLRSILGWIDTNLLSILAFFLLAFIPLYPKIPLWSPIEQYIVRVRIEDFAILLTLLVWGIQVLRRKARWYSLMFWVVLAYAIVGIASTLSGIFYTETIPFQPLHVGKSVLHYFRYLEYFSLFFIFFAAIRDRKDVKKVIAILAATVFAIVVYGYGQKFFYWPVYSTMNREFSKGIRLYLTEFARIQSTFGGHYDMAAYLIVVLPLLLALAYRTKNKLYSAGLHITFWMGTWLLIMSASRTAFAAFFAGALLAIGITSLFRKTWKDKIIFLTTRSFLTLFLIGTLFFYFGQDMAERLSHVVNSNPKLSQISDVIVKQRRMFISDDSLANSVLSPKKLQAMLPRTAPPSNAISTDDVAAAIAATQDVASKSDIPPSPFTPTKPTPVPSASPVATPSARPLPQDVMVEVPEEVVVTTTTPAGKTQTKVVKRQRVYSDCALKNELSLCIRLETLWPQAIEGFLTNPVLGTGYATLTKGEVDQFTEADSTDNNYLRTLGETGALGFLTFYGAVGLVLFYSAMNFRSKDWLKSAFCIGLFSGSIALLINAVYIDVFASSKVAETYWALAGILFAYIAIDKRQKNLNSASTATSNKGAVQSRTTQITRNLGKKNATKKKSF
jgi:hypothetical protein